MNAKVPLTGMYHHKGYLNYSFKKKYSKP